MGLLSRQSLIVALMLASLAVFHSVMATKPLMSKSRPGQKGSSPANNVVSETSTEKTKQSSSTSVGESNSPETEIGSVIAQALANKDMTIASQPSVAAEATEAHSEVIKTLENETPDGQDNAISKAAILKPEPITISQPAPLEKSQKAEVTKREDSMKSISLAKTTKAVTEKSEKKSVSIHTKKSSASQDNHKKKPSKKDSSSKATKKGKKPRPYTEVVPDTTIKMGPKFDWNEVKNKTKLVAKIPGGGSTLPPIDIVGLLKMIPLHSIGAQKSTIDVPIDKLVNASVLNQADIASLDAKSVQNEPSTVNLTSPDLATNASSAVPLPATIVADVSNVTKTENATILSDTQPKGNISSSAGINVPTNIPNKCGGLIKSYTDGEMTLKDYLKEMRKCKYGGSKKSKVSRKATNSSIPMEKKAYYYALHRMMNYQPTHQEAAQANAILDNWRSRSFGDRRGETGVVKTQIPNAIRSFMMVQSDQKANTTAAAVKAKQTIETPVALPVKTTTLLQKPNAGVLMSPQVNAVLPMVDNTLVVKSTAPKIEPALPNPVPETNNKLSALSNLVEPSLPIQEPAKSLYVKPAAAMSPVNPLMSSATFSSLLPQVTVPNPQPAPEFPKLNIPGANKVSNDLLAALESMDNGGPETDLSPVAMVTTAQRRSAPMATLKQLTNLIQRFPFKRELNEKETQSKKNEGSRMDIPANIQPGPKLMDKIRDIGRVIATP